MSDQLTKKWHFYTGPVSDVPSMDNCRIFSGTSNREFSQQVSHHLGIPLNKLKVGTFSDGEVKIDFFDDVRGKDVYIIQSVCASEGKTVNDALVELLLLISAASRSSASKITAVIPYYAYGRQDRKLSARVPISAADIATLISSMGVHRVVTIDLHCGQIAGFFPPRIPVDNLPAGPVGAAFLSERDLVNPVVVSPDAGGVYRAKTFRDILIKKGHPGASMCIIIKQRAGAGKIESMDLVGDVRGKDAIICDDMVDTAGTLCKAAAVLKKHGARRVLAFITHGIFSGPACDRISTSAIDELIVTNTIPLRKRLRSESRVKVVSVAPITAEIIKRLHKDQDISKAFIEKPKKLKATL